MPIRGPWLAVPTLALGLGAGDARATSPLGVWPTSAAGIRNTYDLSSGPLEGVFVVTSTEDTEDVQWGDNACGDTLGRCTLRGAIQEANGHEGADSIRFRIASGPQLIKPKSALPVLFDETTLDATTQPGYAGTPLIHLDGAEAGTSADGVVMAGDASVVKGLAITGFDGIGVVVTDSEGSRLESSYVGVHPDGHTAAGNRGHGVHLLRARMTVIGGTEVSRRNVIGGNGGNGVHIAEVGSRGNRVVGNFIGVGATGVAPVPNRVDGVSIENAPDNEVGGEEAGAVNLIAGNLDDGVEIIGPGAYSNTVQANWIGTAVDGVTPLGHNDAGVLIAGATDNLVIGNVLAASGGFGLELGPQSRGNRALANYVGTNPDGATGLGNGAGGIGVREGAQNVIGAPGLPNRVAGNRGAGILIAGIRAAGNRIEANELGTLGPNVLPNGGFGLVIRDGARENDVVGNSAADGMRVWGAGTDANVLEANRISSAPEPEHLDVGIDISAGPRHTELRDNEVRSARGYAVLIGGTGTSETVLTGNVIAGTRGTGILVDELAGPTRIGANGERPNEINSTSGPAVVLRGSGHTVSGLELLSATDGVVLRGQGHGVFELTALELTGTAVSILEGSGHTVSGLYTADLGAQAIDLGGDGVTANDALDTDAGPNGLLNHPDLRGAVVTEWIGARYTASAELAFEGAPGAELRVDLYAVETCAGGEQAASMVAVGTASIVTGADGRGTKTVTGIPVPDDASGLAATATDGEGSTSELSGCAPLARGRAFIPAAQTNVTPR